VSTGNAVRRHRLEHAKASGISSPAVFKTVVRPVNIPRIRPALFSGRCWCAPQARLDSSPKSNRVADPRPVAEVGAIMGAITATRRRLRRTHANVLENTCAELHLKANIGGPLRTLFWKAPYSPPFCTQRVLDRSRVRAPLPTMSTTMPAPTARQTHPTHEPRGHRLWFANSAHTTSCTSRALRKPTSFTSTTISGRLASLSAQVTPDRHTRELDCESEPIPSGS
jgi:hypothetical protein